MFAVILSIPRFAAVRPQSAPAIIKQLVQNENKTAKVFDLNLDFHKNFRDDAGDAAYLSLDEYFFNTQHIISVDEKVSYQNWMAAWILKITDLDPEFIFISMFTWQCHIFLRDFLLLLRGQSNAKIIVGGQGLSRNEHGSYAASLLFPEELKQDGLIDHWVRGEAETTIRKLINNEISIQGVDSTQLAEYSVVNDHSYADFSDVNAADYFSGFDKGVLPIESSRGCIRKCSFCDIPVMQGGFRFKTGQRLFDELIHYYKSCNVVDFFFHDALSNGSLKDFKIFNNLLTQYYHDNDLPERFLNYSSHYIIRAKSKFKEDDFKTMAAAGAETMVVGIETGSDKVRNDMNKGFTNEDLDHTMQMFSKYGISIYFLIIIGFPTETREDFNETLFMLKKYQKYVADGTIIGVNLGTTLTIEEGTPLWDDCERFDIIGKDGAHPSGPDWICLQNLTLTYKERIKRRVEAQELAVKLGYTFWKGDDQLKILMDRYQTRLSKLDKLVGVIH